MSRSRGSRTERDLQQLLKDRHKKAMVEPALESQEKDASAQHLSNTAQIPWSQPNFIPKFTLPKYNPNAPRSFYSSHFIRGTPSPMIMNGKTNYDFDPEKSPGNSVLSDSWFESSSSATSLKDDVSLSGLSLNSEQSGEQSTD